MMDDVLVIQAFQRRADQLQATLDSLQALLAEHELVTAPDGTDVTDQWLDDLVAKLVRIHSEKAMTEDCVNLWVNKRL